LKGRDLCDLIRHTLYVVSFLKGTERLGNWIHCCPHTKSGDNYQVGCEKWICPQLLHNLWIAVREREIKKITQ